MAEQEYNWPSRDSAKIIGKSHDRLDGLVKATGAAKFTYDINLKNQLIAKALGSPHAHCRVTSVDTSQAEKVPGVVAVHIFPHANPADGNNKPIEWQGELIAAVAAETEAAAVEGVAALKVEYELLESFTQEDDLDAAKAADRTARDNTRVETENEPGDDDDEDEFVDREIKRLLSEAEYVVDGYYGVDCVTHCCLETHGSTVQWNGDKLYVYLSTQNVSGCDDQIANSLGIAANDVDVECQYIGGGFGSKFAPDYWTVAAAQIAKKTGRPVKFMLDRDQDLKIAGNRPSGYINVKLGADKDGMVTVWDSHHWGSAGPQGGGVSVGVIPYVYRPKNNRRTITPIRINAGPARAWRAPNHPQADLLTQTAYDDLAAMMGANSYDIFYKNLDNISASQTADVYRREMEIGAKLIGWKDHWHPHGKGDVNGSIVEGLGMALHTWGGGANTSACQLKIHQDGSVESFCGTQDLGTGTRTVCAMVLAETLGLDVGQVKVNIGKSTYPFSGASGGSTTVGAVSESHRRAAQDALAKLFELAAPKLEAKAGELVATDGRIQVGSQADRSLSWKDACSLLGLKPLEVQSNYQQGTKSPLSSAQVGGVQMAHVAVDRETGVVKIKKFVAVQDMGLIINRKTAESQVFGAMIMGIAYALHEQRILDPKSGAFVNADLRDYKLPRLGDIGELVVELYEPDDQRERGVIGLGEPPVISPGATLSNAVCNALGIRVPVLPMTPKRVLDAIRQSAGRA
jgi:xanthine dehydrogenase YagR molybdenum-binding subunit